MLDPQTYTEPVEFDDPVTGRRVRRLTVSPYHDKHTYYDVSPWDSTGATILLSSADPAQLPPAPRSECHDVGHVQLLPTDGGTPRWLAGPAPFNMHVGCFATWTPDGGTVLFGDEYSDPPRLYLVDVASGRSELLTGLFPRMVHPEGDRVACQSPEGVALLHLASRQRQVLIPYERLVAARPERRVGRPYVANLKWSPDGQRLLLRFSEMADERRVKELWVASADGAQLRRIEAATTRFHHHSWHPDGQHILFGDREDAGPRLYLVHRDGGPARRLSDADLGGHPVFHPDGRRLVTDGADGLWLVDTETGGVEQLATTASNHDVYCQAHPVWTPDGRSVLYDSVQSGTCQLHRVRVD